MADVEIAIIGGGVTGLLLAASLVKHQRRVILLDKGPVNPTVPEDIALVLNARSQQILTQLGLASIYTDAYPLQRCVVSARKHWGRLRFSAQEAALPQLGGVIRLAECYYRLHDMVTQNQLIERLNSVEVTHIRHKDRLNCITYQQGGREIQLGAKMILACDGAESFCRTQFGLSTDSEAIAYKAAVLPVTLRQDVKNTAYQRFLCPGSLAYIPTSGYEGRLIMTLPAAQIERRMHLSTAALMRLLQGELGQLAYTIAKPSGSLRAYPVAMQRASQLATEHGVLLGAAATHMLPITAQGLNLAIRDIDMLNHMLAHRGDNAWGIAQARTYNQRRLPDHQAHYQQIQGLLRIFYGRGGLTSAIRSLGLGAAGSCRSISRLLGLHGAGMQVSLWDLGC